MEDKEQLQQPPQTISMLIAKPLVAAITTNNNMVSNQIDYILQSYFTKTDSGQYKPNTIDLQLPQPLSNPMAMPDPATNTVSPSATIEVPLAAIVPLPGLAINDVTLNFDVEVVDVKEEDDKGSSELYGKICGEKNEGKPIISFAIHAIQMPLPKGLDTLINTFTQGIQPIVNR